MELEDSLLSAYLWDNDTFLSGGAKRSFFTGSRCIVYTAIEKLINSQIEADIVSVSQECMIRDVTSSFVAQISDSPQTVNVEYTVLQLQTLALRRSAVLAWENGTNKLLNPISDPLEIIQEASKSIEFPEDKKSLHIDDAAGRFYDGFLAAKKSGENTAIMTGIASIDRVIGGYEKAEVVVVGARPAHGKTSMTMCWARRWGDDGIPGAIFSLEMSTDQLIRRMACDVGSIDGKYIMRNQMEYDNPDHKDLWGDLRMAVRQISSMPIKINDTPAMGISEIRISARKMAKEDGLRWIIIDYIQLIKGWDIDGQSSKSAIMAEIKAMSKELDITVIAVSQMNRKIEERVRKIPKNSDLRDAGSIEQVADHIVFCIIPSKFPDASEEDLKDTGKSFIFATKTRRGEGGPIFDVRWEGKYFRYYNVAKNYPNESEF